MANQRSTRDSESRSKAERPSDSWVPASKLPMPNPVKGWAFRYVRIANNGQSDVKNASQRFREGWVPVVASEHPELAGVSDRSSEYPEGIEIGGLLLCKIPQERMDARREYYENIATNQIVSVNKAYMNDQDPRMPKYNDSTSRTQFRRG